ncbi:MAG: FAD-dependent monooxygenase [Burkholderiaceae bacterium]|nr:MAG: FAD-dependent monooxygenase [Burkholderiaceae bacterium]TAM02559.1 MAG: FAD-dependent monooxygenase [Pusillimonas sp.]
MVNKQALIVGAGLAGLTLAVALRRYGWEVSVFEKSAALRETGTGLHTWENGLKVLEQLGLYKRATRGVQFLSSMELLDNDHKLIHRIPFSDQLRFCVLPRVQLHTTLSDAALKLGVQIHTNMEAKGADPNGTVTFVDGQQRSGDLIVGADGINSVIRDSISNDHRMETVADGSIRILIPRNEQDSPGIATEYWNGTRRVGTATSSDSLLYVYLSAVTDDEVALAKSFSIESWTSSFPFLRHVFERIPGNDIHVNKTFYYVYVKRWVAGKVVLLGDAAHAMTPNLGQGAASSMTSALEMAIQLNNSESIDDGLSKWEKRIRPMIEMTQIMARAYGSSATVWPAELMGIRSHVLTEVLKSVDINEMISTAARFVTSTNL